MMTMGTERGALGVIMMEKRGEAVSKEARIF